MPPLLATNLDPLMLGLIWVAAVALSLGLLLRRAGLPAILGYLVTGIVLGPHVLAVVPQDAHIARAGDIGVVMLLFFVGMELQPARLLANWRIALLGTGAQVAISVVVVFLLGIALNWPLPRSILLGFVISLSSTAMVLRLLAQRGRTGTRLGEHVTGILLAQDVAIAFMMVITGLMSGMDVSFVMIAKQIAGLALIVGVVWMVAGGRTRDLAFGKFIGEDKEMQVFAALILALGFAALTGFLELSTALGALVGGMVVGSAAGSAWIHHALEPFRVLFLALFFVSIGMLLDLPFLADNIGTVAALSALALITNTLINAQILHRWEHPWRDSLSGGVLLAPIGELSYVLIAVAKQAGLVSDYSYQVTAATVTVTLMLCPLWIWLDMLLSRGAAPVPRVGD